MHQAERIIKQIETDRIIVGLRGDDIIHVYYKKNTIVDPALQDEMIPYFRELTGDRKLPFIYEAGEHVGVTKEARNRALELENLKSISCTAIFAQNFIYKLLGDFYLFIKRPSMPYMVFTDFQEAIDWLLKTHHRMTD